MLIGLGERSKGGFCQFALLDIVEHVSLNEVAQGIISALPRAFLEASKCRTPSAAVLSVVATGLIRAPPCCLSGEIISNRGLSAPPFTILVQKWKACKYCETEPSIPSPTGKSLSSSVIYLWLSVSSKSPGSEGEYYLILLNVPLYWNLGRGVRSRCSSINPFQWLPASEY